MTNVKTFSATKVSNRRFITSFSSRGAISKQTITSLIKEGGNFPVTAFLF